MIARTMTATDRRDALLIDSLRDILPPEAEFVAHHAKGAILIECSWRSGADSQEPYKRPLPIHIFITKEVAGRLSAAGGERLLQLRDRIVQRITDRLQAYPSDLELPPGVVRDPVSIRITTQNIDRLG